MNSDKDKIVSKFHGEYVDYVYEASTGKLVRIIKGHNIVTNSCSKLIAGLIAGKITKGAMYWAVGQGQAAWDSTPHTPSADDTKLTSEIARVQVTAENFKYVNDIGNEVDGVSNKIKCTVTFDEATGNGMWREFGLFGGDDATGVLDTGIMIDHIVQDEAFNKTTEFVVTRTLTLTF